MSLTTDLDGQTFATTIYDSVIGKIIVETSFCYGIPTTTLWVQFPDGFSDEVQNLQEACEKLEL